MRLGRFVVETHCHPQRIAARMQDDDTNYSRLWKKMVTAVEADEADEDDDIVIYDNSDRLLFDMDRYNVDMCVLLPGGWFTNNLNRKIMEKHPGKFVSAATAMQTEKAHYRGEEEWTIDAACEEIDEWLRKDGFKMIGEGVTRNPAIHEENKIMDWSDRREEVRKVFDVAADHDVPVGWHTGAATGYTSGTHMAPDWEDPLLAGEIKKEYPEVPIIFQHGGMQGHWRESYVEKCCQIAAAWDDVYLETGLYWADLFKKPYNDPNVGPEQMIWGGDWGASLPQVSQPGQDPPFYWDQVNDRGLPAHQCDYWGASMRQLLKFSMENEIEQDKLNLILGGNIARLLDLDLPHNRLFENYLGT